ncbi:2173_t:CDS:2 [Funneliformis caledonium]|uniref:2173_t:CDS:1 n=1 Tax=Funneliformis caledonium TaxID=1117310 RepID=A0A9N8YRE5_9GLOM|nr:2173_t:CDS:2 [Funneliformis caledonium]
MERIQVDELEDILCIQNGIKDLVSSYVQKYLDSNTDNDLKSRVTSAVKKWIDDTFKMCSPNLEVNGMTYDKALKEKDVEPFDENLLSNLISLESDVDVMTLRVTENRRNSPEIIKKNFEEILLLQSFMKNHAEIIDDDDMGICDMQIDSDTVTSGVILSEQFSERVVQTYDQSLSLLTELKKSTTANLSRFERAQTVVADINKFNPTS